MAAFQQGETVVLSIVIKNAAGTLTSPATSTKITITSPTGTALVTDVAMTEDSVGNFHYDFLSPAVNGTYTAKFVATDASRISIARAQFVIES